MRPVSATSACLHSGGDRSTLGYLTAPCSWEFPLFPPEQLRHAGDARVLAGRAWLVPVGRGLRTTRQERQPGISVGTASPVRGPARCASWHPHGKAERGDAAVAFLAQRAARAAPYSSASCSICRGTQAG